MKRKPLFITAIIALAVIGVIAVALFMKDSRPAASKKEQVNDAEAAPEREVKPANTDSNE